MKPSLSSICTPILLGYAHFTYPLLSVTSEFTVALIMGTSMKFGETCTPDTHVRIEGTMFA